MCVFIDFHCLLATISRDQDEHERDNFLNLADVAAFVKVLTANKLFMLCLEEVRFHTIEMEKKYC